MHYRVIKGSFLLGGWDECLIGCSAHLIIYLCEHLSPIIRLKARGDHEAIFSEPIAEY